MKALLLTYLESGKAVTYLSLLTGAVAVAIACFLSERPPAEVVKGASWLAVMCNAAAVVGLFFKRKAPRPDWDEIIDKLRSNQIDPWKVFVKFLPLFVCFSVMLFWGGWFIFGMFAIFLGR